MTVEIADREVPRRVRRTRRRSSRKNREVIRLILTRGQAKRGCPVRAPWVKPPRDESFLSHARALLRLTGGIDRYLSNLGRSSHRQYWTMVLSDRSTRHRR